MLSLKIFKYRNFRRITGSFKHHLQLALSFLLLDQLLQNLVECGGDLGSIECINGKWQVDTKIISLIVVCPIQISWETLMCVFKRLGLYDNGQLNEDFHIYLCSLLSTPELIDFCITEVGNCLGGVIGGINNLQWFMLPVGYCVWNAIHGKVVSIPRTLGITRKCAQHRWHELHCLGLLQKL